MQKKRYVRSFLAALLIAGFCWLIWGNTTVGLTRYDLQEDRLPDAFDGCRIAHVSDLHNSKLWKQTIKRLKEAKPDLICITGDLVDSRSPDLQIAFAFAEAAVQIAPCYYITGNHEVRLEQCDQLLTGLQERGVTVLQDEAVLLEKGDQAIALAGHQWGNTKRVGRITDFAGYRILLSHPPEAMDHYVAGGYDLVLSGHAHGGQFRLPILGGLYAPGQGFLPEYDSGIFSRGETDLVVSRGVGNSVFPIRFHNRPEVIVITLHALEG